MITFESGLYVRIQEMHPDVVCNPRPLQNGFNNETAYRVLGGESYSETSESFMTLANETDQIWFIPTRHLRVVGVFHIIYDLRYPLKREV